MPFLWKRGKRKKGKCERKEKRGKKREIGKGDVKKMNAK
jgi:hypothetical protein